MKSIEKNKEIQKKLTANELTNVADISNDVIYTKDGYLIKIMRLYSINISLLSVAERKSKSDTLTGEFKGESNDFTILSIPRTVDMDDYLDYLSNKNEEEMSNPMRKMILKEMVNEATRKIMSGANFEHQHFLMIWEKEKIDGNYGYVEAELEKRMRDFENRYATIQNQTKVLNDTELLRLCNLFGNSNTALFETYESNNQYTPIPWIKGGSNV